MRLLAAIGLLLFTQSAKCQFDTGGFVVPACQTNAVCTTFNAPGFRIVGPNGVIFNDGSVQYTASSGGGGSFTGGYVSGVTTFGSTVTVSGQDSSGYSLAVASGINAGSGCINLQGGEMCGPPTPPLLVCTPGSSGLGSILCQTPSNVSPSVATANGAIAMGWLDNRATGTGCLALGGEGNHCTALYGGAFGNNSVSAHNGAWVWSDYDSGFSNIYNDNGVDTFNIRADGGFYVDVDPTVFPFTNQFRVVNGSGTVAFSMTATTFFGDGSHLTGISSGGETNYFAPSKTFGSSVTVNGDFISTGTITADLELQTTVVTSTPGDGTSILVTASSSPDVTAGQISLMGGQQNSSHGTNPGGAILETGGNGYGLDANQGPGCFVYPSHPAPPFNEDPQLGNAIIGVGGYAGSFDFWGNPITNLNSGGQVYIRGGTGDTGCQTAQFGGDVNILGGAANSNTAGNVNISGGQGAAGGAGAVAIVGGPNNAAAPQGNVVLQSGSGVTGISEIDLYGGDGVTTNGSIVLRSSGTNGGDVWISSGPLHVQGNTDVSGSVTASTFNSVGSAYQMHGQTVIDTGANVIASSGTFAANVMTGNRLTTQGTSPQYTLNGTSGNGTTILMSDSGHQAQIQFDAFHTLTLLSDFNNGLMLVQNKLGMLVNPAYTLDVGGDINTSSVYRVSGTQIASSNLSDGGSLLKTGTDISVATVTASGQANIGYEMITNSCGAGVTTCNANCTSGKVLTGGGCNAGVGLSQDAPNSNSQWGCTSLTITTLTSYAFCARLGP